MFVLDSLSYYCGSQGISREESAETGDMRILIKHAELVNVVHEVYAREVETSWPKGKPPY